MSRNDGRRAGRSSHHRRLPRKLREGGRGRKEGDEGEGGRKGMDLGHGSRRRYIWIEGEGKETDEREELSGGDNKC